jgi:hypothetical protein
MRTLRLLFLASILTTILALAVFGWPRPSYAQDTFEYVYETGHYVRGELLTFYRSVENPIEVYGYPITEAYQDTATGVTVQYFEKARFEVHPTEPAASRVRLSPLGEYLYEPGLPQYEDDNTAACQAFSPDGFLVCYDFLNFYLENGGAAQFGLPISNIELYKGIKVQYFQNARLEWRPGRNGQSWIVVGRMGWEYFYKIGEDIKKTLPVEPPISNGIPQVAPIQRLQARAYARYPVTARRATQTVFILLHDQRYLPIEAADVAVVVRWPSGAESRFIATGATDANGITKVEFQVNSNEIGLATVQVEGTYNRMPIKTVTSFRIWW